MHARFRSWAAVPLLGAAFLTNFGQGHAHDTANLFESLSTNNKQSIDSWYGAKPVPHTPLLHCSTACILTKLAVIG